MNPRAPVAKLGEEEMSDQWDPDAAFSDAPDWTTGKIGGGGGRHRNEEARQLRAAREQELELLHSIALRINAYLDAERTRKK
jgi:hypothetical protein